MLKDLFTKKTKMEINKISNDTEKGIKKEVQLNPDKLNGFVIIGVVIGVPLLLWSLAGLLPQQTQAVEPDPIMAVEEWKKEWDGLTADIDNLKAQIKVKELALCLSEKKGAKIKLELNGTHTDKYPLSQEDIVRLAEKRDSINCLSDFQ